RIVDGGAGRRPDVDASRDGGPAGGRDRGGDGRGLPGNRLGAEGRRGALAGGDGHQDPASVRADLVAWTALARATARWKTRRTAGELELTSGGAAVPVGPAGDDPPVRGGRGRGMAPCPLRGHRRHRDAVRRAGADG